MKSKWYEYKAEAEKLRRKGLSIRTIENRLGIPRSTLSGWFKEIKLSKTNQERLNKKWLNSLVKARKKAVSWHNNQKQERLRYAEDEARHVLEALTINNSATLELALAILYFGEGSKKNCETAIGSSDPLMLKFFVTLLKNNYHVDIKKIRCELGLRADQDPEKMKRFWARELRLPLSNFKQVNFDKRTQGSKTYSS